MLELLVLVLEVLDDAAGLPVPDLDDLAAAHLAGAAAALAAFLPSGTEKHRVNEFNL